MSKPVAFLPMPGALVIVKIKGALYIARCLGERESQFQRSYSTVLPLFNISKGKIVEQCPSGNFVEQVDSSNTRPASLEFLAAYRDACYCRIQASEDALMVLLSSTLHDPLIAAHQYQIPTLINPNKTPTAVLESIYPDAHRRVRIL